MSINLVLTAPGGASFALKQTPTHVADDAQKVRFEPKATRALYLEWFEDLGWPVIDVLAHKCELFEWLLEHPDHKWNAG